MNEMKLSAMREDIISGLKRLPKVLSPKYFYDDEGSRLFEKICELDEYYLTRTEREILEDYAAEMAAFFGDGCRVFEFGSGSSKKTRLLLKYFKKGSVYLPVDISKDFLFRCAGDLAKEFPQLTIKPVCADFTGPLDNLYEDEGRRAIYFPGSTIGNFEPQEAQRFFENACAFLGSGGRMIVGVDLAKDPTVLEAAYNDSQGITAQFNVNVLKRMNRELGADFDLKNFKHRAHYNFLESRIEMHLISAVDQVVTIDGESIAFKAGESIHTENSYKYAPSTFAKLAAYAGLKVARTWTDRRHRFAVFGLETARAIRKGVIPSRAGRENFRARIVL
jgi:L-histidine Nalpha-methyltransferase